MNEQQQKAYEWAKNQNYPSVAAQYARVLAGVVDELQSQLADKTALFDAAISGQETLQAQLTVEKRRADAAVEDINLLAPCDVCKHYDADEIACAKPNVDSFSCFEWRGVKEERE